ncbi:secreted RxLR effector protein 161-like [Xenia sp. Carnegie-2017]|uniref:secreted RxLR effector protein 161-like n=1 Tax=Xenia sp. Carnegie-2017 TaxID=2897299 RepID=UPI001F04EF21|nr:secreted RxLR effector protein 161-like [Xenia sp. Carnegie-2017]
MAISCLTYATVATRPDLAAAVATLSKYMSRPGKDHWQAVKRVFRYIKGTMEYGLLFTANGKDSGLCGFADANWGGAIEARRSTSWHVFQIQNSTISWCSKRETSVSRSTTEAEYIALSSASQECIRLRRLLNDIELLKPVPTAI